MATRQNEASGYITEPAAHISNDFTEINEIHRSERNIVLKAKRYGQWWILKCATPGPGFTVSSAALRKEFEISLKLPREGTVHTYAMEYVEGIGHCIIMEYIDGITLRDWLNTGPTTKRREDMACRIIKILGSVHQNGVVHRDINPDNIMVSSISNNPVLIDFGLADTCTHSELKSPAGTRGYVSAEQCVANEPDIRNDIYSLGRLLEDMQLPFYWRRPIKKSMLPIETRVADAPTLLELCLNSRKLYRSIPSNAFKLLGFSALIAMAIVLSNRPQQSNGEVRQIIVRDTVERDNDSLKAAYENRLSTLSRELSYTQDSISRSNSERERRRQSVAEAIRAEERVLDRIWANTGMKYLDTVNIAGFVANAYSTAPMDKELDRFLTEGKSKFSAEELLLMDQSLRKKISDNLNLWLERRRKMPLDY